MYCNSQIFRLCTCCSTLLDHVYTNNVVGEHKSFILVEDVSDHLPVMVYFNLSLRKSEKSTVTLIAVLCEAGKVVVLCEVYLLQYCVKLVKLATYVNFFASFPSN